jgi:hypothetical protein
VTVVIRPAGGDDYALPAADFVKQVEALRQLLALSDPSGVAEARIIGLHMNSPATISLNAVGRENVPMDLSGFFGGLETVALGGPAPRDFGRPVFDAFRDFASVVGRGVSSATIQVGGKTIVIDVAARKNIEAVFGPDESSEGSLDGMLEAINVHGKSNTFALYPIVGASRVSCKFEEGLLAQVRPALGKYVVIGGELKYRWREKFPYEARANRIEILSGWDDQPSFSSILGLAPNATGGLLSEEFVRNERHGWQ